MRLVVISYGHAGKINQYQFSECMKKGEEKNNKRPPGQEEGIAIMRNARRRTEPPYPTACGLVCVWVQGRNRANPGPLNHLPVSAPTSEDPDLAPNMLDSSHTIH